MLASVSLATLPGQEEAVVLTTLVPVLLLLEQPGMVQLLALLARVQSRLLFPRPRPGTR
jgi:hypothetical protein